MAVDSGTTPESIKRRRAIAEAMLLQGMREKPIEHWTQGLGQMAEAFVGGRMMHRADEREAAERKAARADFLRAFGYGGETAAPEMAGAKPYGGMRPDGTPDVNVASSHDAVKMPRGLRNNNPLNIEAGAFAQGQPGYTGSDGRFAQFASLDHGTSAASNLLAVYGSKHGINTVNGAVGRWAPAADGNPVGAYSSHVAKALGVDPSAPIDLSNPEIREKMVQAMAAFENGQPLPQGRARPQRTAQAGGVNPALIEAMSNPFMPSGFQTIGAAMLSKQMEPTKYGFTTLPDGTVMRTDPRAGTVSPIYQAGAKPTSDQQNYNAAKNDPGFREFLDRSETPKVGEFFDAETGMPYKAVWNRGTGEWQRIGGIKAPSGLSVTTNPDGTVRITQGAGMQEKAEKNEEMKAVSAGIVDYNIDNAISRIEANPSWTTGLSGQLFSGVGGTEAHAVQEMLGTVKANIGFDKLQAMRDASKTGGALGQVSEFENRLLQAVWGSLAQSQQTADLLGNLRLLKYVVNGIANGVPDGKGGVRRLTQDDIKAFAPTPNNDPLGIRN